MKIEIKEPWWPRAVALFCSLCNVTVGMLSLQTGWRTHEVVCVWVGWFLLTMGTVSVVWDVFRLSDRRPLLRIDHEGIYDRQLGVGLIPWADIRKAFLQSDSTRYRVCLDVVNADSYLARASAWLRFQRGRPFDLQGTPLYVDLTRKALLPKSVLEFIQAHIPKQVAVY